MAPVAFVGVSWPSTGAVLAHRRFAFSNPELTKLYVIAETGREEQWDRTTVVLRLEL